MKLKLPDATLSDAGFLLQGVLARQTAGYSQLWVLGNTGQSLWQAISLVGKDPIDGYAVQTASKYLAGHGLDDFRVMYPADNVEIDLISLGRELGWHHDSPLGSGIHPEYGSWFAYRVVIALPDVFEVPAVRQTVSPCENCRDKPCLAACPVGATGQPFDLDACASHRLASRECAGRCLARDACPVGRQYRYSDAQMQYHYGLSLQSIRRMKQQTGQGK